MGVDVTGFDILETIAGISDPEVAQMAIKAIGREMPLHLGAAAEITLEGDMLRVTAGDQSVLVERVLASLGRKPNLQELALENSGLELDQRGVPLFDPNTMQCGDSRIFIAGDVNADRQLLHEAGDEGRIAGHNACLEQAEPFQRKTPIGIVFCDPNIAAVGTRWSELDPETTAAGEVNFAPVGRALIMGSNRGMLRLYADKTSGRLLGAEMFCARGEHLAHLLAWSIQQGMSVGEMLQMPFYHPVLEEAMQAALYDCYAKIETKNAGPITELQPL
jgi:dihydrolipoamide dehydrogenase